MGVDASNRTLWWEWSQAAGRQLGRQKGGGGGARSTSMKAADSYERVARPADDQMPADYRLIVG